MHANQERLEDRSASSTAMVCAALAIGLGHLGVVLLMAKPLIASNVMQELAPGIAALVCWRERNRANCSRWERQAWFFLIAACGLWIAGQSLYLIHLLFPANRALPAASEMVWLLFALPLLMIAYQANRRDLVVWIDNGQSAFLSIVLFALLFCPPVSLNSIQAYSVQALVLILTCTLRYSTAVEPAERLFFRNLLIFVVLSGGLSILEYMPRIVDERMRSFMEVGWSVPFVVFSILVLTSHWPERRAVAKAARRTSSSHLQGISALGLAVLSMAGSGLLAVRHPQLGIASLALAFLLFVLRTSVREWELRTAKAEIEYAAFHDSMTGLANRALVTRELTRRMTAGPAASGRAPGVLLIDVDRFKIINDSLGYSFGDRLLLNLAARISAAVRPGDIVARQGADEFLVLFQDADIEQAAALSERVVAAFREPVRLENRVIYLTGSAGLVLAEEGWSAESVLRKADCAMYKAKSLGKDRVERFSASMQSLADRKLLIEMELRSALENNALAVHYQPIYDLAATRKIVGFEALSRWTHPEMGRVGPDEFIPVAEDSGLIIPLGRSALLTACRDLHTWNQRFGTELTVSVNVSARQFDDPAFLQEIVGVLRETGLPPGHLKLEMTESVLLSGHKLVSSVLAECRRMGIQIYLDDFGTGYSSLSYLLHYPFDVIKIDKSFVRHLTDDRVRAELVRTVVQMSQNLGKRVVAEGVETDEEYQFLRTIGCDMVQGFLLAKPMIAVMIEDLILTEFQAAQPARPSTSAFASAIAGSAAA